MKYSAENHAYRMNTEGERKFMQEAFDCYLASDWNSVYDAYERPSYEKVTSFTSHVNTIKATHGMASEPKVITRNTFMYTMGLISQDVVTGEAIFMYITPTYKRYIALSELVH